MAGFMISCGSDSDSNNGGSSGNAGDLVAKWYNDQHFANNDVATGLVCEFQSDGTYILYMYQPMPMHGKYTVNGNTISIIMGEMTVATGNYSISGTVLNITNLNSYTSTQYLYGGNHYKKQ